jgi:sec-independent protein translocase protein TatA
VFRNFGATELLIILLIVLLVFGAKKLPGLARSLGASAKEFKEGIEQGSDEPEASQSDATETSDS